MSVILKPGMSSILFCDVMSGEAAFHFALKSSVLFCFSCFLLLCLLQTHSHINL